jgi:hypothetical protein
LNVGLSHAKKVNVGPYLDLRCNSIPNQKWEEVSMKFIIRLPLSKGKNPIFVVVDNSIPLTTKFIGIRIVYLLFKNVYTLHGSTHHIICDNDVEFVSNLFFEKYSLYSQ